MIFYSKTKSKKSGKNNINETLDSDIKGSDVIITDKQFYSVGLKFNMDTMDAPIINFLSDNIIEIESKAERFKIPEIINRPLTIELFNNHNVGEEIAVLYYSPVSKIYKEIWNKK